LVPGGSYLHGNRATNQRVTQSLAGAGQCGKRCVTEIDQIPLLTRLLDARVRGLSPLPRTLGQGTLADGSQQKKERFCIALKCLPLEFRIEVSDSQSPLYT